MDDTAARAASRADATELITHLTGAISSRLDLSGVLQAVTDTGTRLSGAAFGAFFYNAVDETGQRYRLHVLSGASKERFAGMPAPRITALFEPTFAGEETVRVDDVTRDPRVGGLPAQHLPLRSYLATPVVARDGHPIGALLFGHPDPAVFDEASEVVVRAVAAQAAVAVENARLFEAEQAARRDAERVAAEVSTLQAVTARLASTLRPEEALDAVVDTIVHRVGAARVAVYLREDEVFRPVTSTDAPLARRPYADEVPAGAATLVRDATERGVPVWVSTRAELEATYGPVAEAAPDVAAALALPLRVTDATRGAMTLTWHSPREFCPDQVRLLEAVAGQLAATLERQRLLAAEASAQAELRRHMEQLREASQTLQRSLLPQRLPDADGIDVAVRYLPGTEGAEVGGDWYDVVVAPDGVVTLVIGDVQGHSFSAAAVMGKVSTALHAYLVEGHSPQVALERVNPLVEATGVLVTCCLVGMDPATGLVRLVRAGHPLPVFRAADGGALEVDVEGGPPLGVLPGATWPVTTGRARPGDRLVLYTDGLVERPGGDMDAEVARVVASLEHCDGGVEAVAEQVLGGVSGGSGDDVALLVAEYTHVTAGAASVRLRVESLAAIAAARRFTRDQLDQWDLAAVTEDASLVVSEMVTNALLHAGGPATLELRAVSGGVRVAVTDGQSGAPELREPDVDEVGGRGLLLVESVAAAWGVDPAGAGKTVWAVLHR